MDREMPQAGVRPRSVTVIAWIAILSVVVTIAGLIADRAAPGPMLASSDSWERLLLGLGLLALPLTFLAGLALLNGRNWARLVLGLWPVLGLALFGLDYADGWEMAFDLLAFGLTGYFLFNRRADAFFGRSYLR